MKSSLAFSAASLMKISKMFSIQHLRELCRPMPDDQFNFLFTQLFAFFYAFIFKYFLIKLRLNSNGDNNNNNENDGKRKKNDDYKNDDLVGEDDGSFQSFINHKLIHLMSIVPSLFMLYFSHGNHIFYVIFITVTCYFLIHNINLKYIHLTIFIWAISVLSFLHIKRLFNPLSRFLIEVDGPIMIMVQKLTSFAFSLHDGYLIRKNDPKQKELNSEQRKNAIRTIPNGLEFFSFLYDFNTLNCGPTLTFNDYKEYYNCTKLKKNNLQSYPSVWLNLVIELCTAFICAFVFLVLEPLFPIEYLLEEEYRQANFLYKLWALYLVAFACRVKYFFAWKLAECICNASGLGFNGLDPKTGDARYNLAMNIQIFNFEMAISLRNALAVWNITTTKWLRHVAYDRTPKRLKVISAFTLSALWHGFYPGYYLTFFTAGLFTLASRCARKCLRYRFTGSQRLLNSYHVLTFFTTRIMIAYLSFPFIMLDFMHSCMVFHTLYWFGHWMALYAWLILPDMCQMEQKTNRTSQTRFSLRQPPDVPFLSTSTTASDKDAKQPATAAAASQQPAPVANANANNLVDDDRRSEDTQLLPFSPPKNKSSPTPPSVSLRQSPIQQQQNQSKLPVSPVAAIATLTIQQAAAAVVAEPPPSPPLTPDPLIESSKMATLDRSPAEEAAAAIVQQVATATKTIDASAVPPSPPSSPVPMMTPNPSFNVAAIHSPSASSSSKQAGKPKDEPAPAPPQP